MAWNSAVVLRYGTPVAGREKVAMGNFREALALLGRWAADGKCSEPLVLHHISGGGMIVVLTDSAEASLAMLRDGQVRRHVDMAAFSSSDFSVEMMVTGETLMQEVETYTAVGEELGFL